MGWVAILMFLIGTLPLPFLSGLVGFVLDDIGPCGVSRALLWSRYVAFCCTFSFGLRIRIMFNLFPRRLLGRVALVVPFLLILPVLALVSLAVLLRSGVSKTSESLQKRTWLTLCPGNDPLKRLEKLLIGFVRLIFL